ncbi:MAG: hypothetical protein KAR06_01355 [Deltaproteobacteria bacterium]|nr:hypothetical protein [Deltaproteobacteria bacterium]
MGKKMKVITVPVQAEAMKELQRKAYPFPAFTNCPCSICKTKKEKS